MENRQRMVPPVKEGDEFDVTIEATGEKGDGIARRQGFVIFVPGVKEGDNVKIKVTRVLRKVGFAELVGKASAPQESAPEEATSESDEPAEEEAPAEEGSEGSEDFGEETEEEPKEEEPTE